MDDLSYSEESGLYDLLFKGGVVADQSQGLHGDIAIGKGMSDTVRKDIPADQAKETFDTTGLMTVPGLVDIPVHVYPCLSNHRIHADTHYSQL